MSALRIDTAEFTRRGDTAEGRLAVDSLPRLVTLLESADGGIVWRLQGRTEPRADGGRESLLALRADGSVSMRCVRCLEPVEVRFAVRRDYRLVSTEAQAEREDLDDEAFDLLVGGRSFDLGELIEDEAILDLPAAPQHADCRAATTGTDAAPAVPDTRRPFEVLKGWRGGSTD